MAVHILAPESLRCFKEVELVFRLGSYLYCFSIINIYTHTHIHIHIHIYIYIYIMCIYIFPKDW